MIDSWFTGHTVALLGWVHGNEPSGISAIMKLLQSIRMGNLSLMRGKLILIPVSNPLAHAHWLRYVEKDLNRSFRRDFVSPMYKEERLAQDIMSILSDHDVSLLLDLHSTSGPSAPFLFCEKPNLSLWALFGVRYIITWWSTLGNWVLSWDVENYMNSFSGKMGFTFESGNHESPVGEKNAYQMALNFLVRCDMIGQSNFLPLHPETTVLDMKRVYILEWNDFEYSIPRIESFIFIEEWMNKIGYSIANDWKKTPIYADPWDILIMPKLWEICCGDEVFFLWTICKEE